MKVDNIILQYIHVYQHIYVYMYGCILVYNNKILLFKIFKIRIAK